MVKVSYQVIFRGENFKEENFKEILKSILEEIYKDVYDESIENDLFGDIIEIKYYHKINENKYIIGFDIDFSIFIPEDLEKYDIDKDEYIKKIIKNFNKNLLDNENIETAFKFYDENLLNQLKKLYNEIFEIEMKLREALTFIFILNYKEKINDIGDYYNLLDEYNFKLSKDIKNDKENYLKNRLENELFHLLFDDYTKFIGKNKNLKKISNLEDILPYIEQSDNFEDFKFKIQNRGITHEKFTNFLSSIENDLKIIERIRNCVAHYRNIEKAISDEYKDSSSSENYYDKYKNSLNCLKTKLEKVLETIKPKVIFATIYVEEIMPNVYRQNSTTLQIMFFGKYHEEEIDFGDEMIHGDDIYDVGDDFKELLLKYLEDNGYNIDYLDKSRIEIEHI